MKTIYEAVRRLPPVWRESFFPIAKRVVLNRLINDRELRTVIEIGSWRGNSTAYFAKRARVWKGTVYAIDLWNAASKEECELGIEGLPPVDQVAFQQFLSNMIDQELTDTVLPVRMSSAEAALSLEAPLADLIYVDAGHTATACFQDILAYHPRLAEGGLICGDDWDMASVRLGVTSAAAILKKEVGADGHIWWFK